MHLNLWQTGPSELLGGLQLIQGGHVADSAPQDIEDNVDSGIDGGLNFFPGRLHTNRVSFAGRRGIAETKEVQDKLLWHLMDHIKPF